MSHKGTEHTALATLASLVYLLRLMCQNLMEQNLFSTYVVATENFLWKEGKSEKHQPFRADSDTREANIEHRKRSDDVLSVHIQM